MVQQAAIEQRTDSGDTLVSAETYLEQYAQDHYEWVEGKLIKMPPITGTHDELTQYFVILFKTYFAARPIGRLRLDPFVMRLEPASGAFRIPDVQIILDDNPGDLTETAMLGPADIVIEIVSPESISRDHGEKFDAYRLAGVREYWIVDPINIQCRFNRLREDGSYATTLIGDAGEYTTPLLPDLVIDVAIFWRAEMPDLFAIVNAVRAMLGE